MMFCRRCSSEGIIEICVSCAAKAEDSERWAQEKVCAAVVRAEAAEKRVAELQAWADDLSRELVSARGHVAELEAEVAIERCGCDSIGEVNNDLRDLAAMQTDAVECMKAEVARLNALVDAAKELISDAKDEAWRHAAWCQKAVAWFVSMRELAEKEKT